MRHTMFTKHTIVGRMLGSVAAAATLCFSTVALADEPPFVPRQALIELAPGSSIQAIHAQYGTSTLREIASRRIYLVQLPQAGNEPEFVDDARSDARIVRSDLNYIGDNGDANGTGQSIFLFRTVSQYQQDPSYAAANSTAALPGGQGEGVLIAVLDSGIDATHPQLAGRVDPRGYDFLLRQPGVTDVGDGLDNNADNRVDEYVGHGTAVAGIIARVAPNASILPIRVMDSDGVANIFAVTEGVYHAIDNGARVINISIGTYGDPTILSDALRQARLANISVVAAAGNDGVSSPVFMPAGLNAEGVISVTAVGSTRVRPMFSNFGTWIDLSAPGELVTSILPNGQYGAASGTSFAAPFVSGAIALVRSECTAITPDEAALRVRSSAQSVDAVNPNFQGELGAGIVQAAAAAIQATSGANPCVCRADFDRDGGVTTADILAYLNLWFAQDASADIDGDGTHDAADIFAFLSLWFIGC